MPTENEIKYSSVLFHKQAAGYKLAAKERGFITALRDRTRYVAASLSAIYTIMLGL